MGRQRLHMERLTCELQRRNLPSIEIPFDAFSSFGVQLSDSAKTYIQYWSNTGKLSKFWKEAGYLVKKPSSVPSSRKVIFIKMRNEKMGQQENESTKTSKKVCSILTPKLASSLLGYFYRTIFVGDNKENSTQRYLSWEHCYAFFREMRKKYLVKKEVKVGPGWEKDLDLMALHLGFYLASWGMYRGSSFFLAHDYKFHKRVVEYLFEKGEIWERDYTSSDELKTEFNATEKIKISDVFDKRSKFLETIQKCYFGAGRGDIDESVAESEDSEVSKRNITQTQLTKILLGTCGCIPAYDRYFCDGARKTGFSGTLSSNSYIELVDFWNKNAEGILKILEENEALPRYKNQDGSFGYYPPMKLVDMIFWQLGMLIGQREAYHESENDPSKKKQKVIAVLELYKTIKTKNFDGLLSPKEMLTALYPGVKESIDRIEIKGDAINKLYESVCEKENMKKDVEVDIEDKCDYLLDYLPKKRRLDDVDFDSVIE